MFGNFLIGIVCLEIAASVNYYGPIWSYDDEAKWPGRRCKEGGKRQSPIDIRTSAVLKDYNREFIRHGPLKFSGYEKVLVSGINNGHTVQFSTEGDTGMHPLVTGGPLKHQYRLEQMHFHWLSEHAIDGFKHPMELHFVHLRSDLPVSKALKKKDGLAVVSVFCNVQTDMEESQEEMTSEITQYLPKLMQTGDRVSGVLLDLNKLLSPDLQSYYTYAGSLTSPQCNEAVIWIIFTTPIIMTDTQYRLFGKIGLGRHNFRSLQRLNKHTVYSPPTRDVATPQIVTFVVDMFKMVTQFFKNVTRFMRNRFRAR